MPSPPAKRQKLDTAVDVFPAPTAADPSTLITVRDLSFQSPLRKKLTLIISPSTVSAHSAAKEELSVPLSQIVHIICVPAPDKTAKTWNFVLVLKDAEEFDSWVFGVPDSVAKTAVLGPDLSSLDTTQSYRSLLLEAFRRITTNVPVVEPSTQDFFSPMPVPGRPKDTAFHVIAHRGAKEGFLFFLSTCILYGFRKPVLFFPLEKIREVTFTNILQRTFDLVVSTEDDVEGEEFGMIDQAVFEGIMGYVKRHSIQDASLSEMRKAKKKAAKNGEDVEMGGELAKAVEEYDAEYDDDGGHFRDFEKAEKERKEDEDGSDVGLKTAGKRKRKPVPPGKRAGGFAANGVDLPSSDDEDEDETFELGGSDDESVAGSGEEKNKSGGGSGSEDDDDSDEDSDEDDDEDSDESDDDDDDDEEDEDEDEDDEDEDED